MCLWEKISKKAIIGSTKLNKFYGGAWLNIPLLDLKAQHELIRQEIMDALFRVIESNHFILGPEVQRLEEQIAAYCQTDYAIGVSSGTDALLISLMALGIREGDEVITTPFSFFATAGVIARLGAKPVFVDIDPQTYNINPQLIDQEITPRTRAIIPVHLFGQCVDMEPILEIASKHGLKIIEDAAQSIGAEYMNGQRAGSIGQIGCLSFFPSKNLGALGDGGMVLTSDEDLAERLRVLRVHGSKPKYYHKMIGGNFRLDELQAAVLNIKLKYLDDWTRQRQENAKQYVTIFKDTYLLDEKKVILPKAIYSHNGYPNFHIYNQFIIRGQARDQLQNYLKGKGVGTEIYYPVPFHLQECFRSLSYKMGDFPESERAAKETLSLPIYPGLTFEQQKYIVESIREFYSNENKISAS